MNPTKYPLHSQRPETPQSSSVSRRPSSLSEKGMVSLTEAMIASLIVALLLGAGVYALRITERGTISQKKREQAYNLAKSKTEEIKAYINAQNWNQIQADVRFPPAATPAITPYLSYAPTTIQEGNNKFILSPTVRYVYSDATSQLVYVPTPGTVSTPETGNIVKVSVAGYYGDLSAFEPLPTVEAGNLQKSQIVYSNFVSNKFIYAGSPGQISGHIYINCVSTAPVTSSSVEVGLYDGVQKIKSALTDSTGYYQFNDVQEGIYSIQLVSSPGYYDGGPCTFTSPVTIQPGTNLSGEDVNAIPLPVWNYYGKVVYTSPVTVKPVPPTSPTPTPNPTPMTTNPVNSPIVFADDTNSSAVTASPSGAYTITQVRSTPIAGHNFDTIEADDDPTTQSGKNYNVGSSMYGSYVSLGQTWIGPITVYINAGVTNRQPVTFLSLNELYATMPVANSPMTLSVADSSPVPPATIFSSPVSSVPLNVHPGVPQVTLKLTGNTSPPSFINFDQQVNIDAGVTTPLTLVNFAVGTAAGTIAGAGASFDYAQFYVTAQDDQGQYVYNIPVSYNGSATFGTFKYTYLRTPLVAGGDLVYTFSAGGNPNYTSTSSQKTISQGVSQNLDEVIFVSPLNVYMAVTVTNNGAPYPYGSWVSAIVGSAAAPPTTGMGNGFGISNYYSTLTQGTGTGSIQVQLTAAANTTFTVFSQIVDPTTYALSTKAVTVTMTSAHTFASPKGISFAFP